MRPLPLPFRQSLLSQYSSRVNKLWLLITWQRDGYAIEWRWQGAAFRSRLEFDFGDGWQVAQSYDDDIRPNLRTAGTPAA
jgi:hypothetical protein